MRYLSREEGKEWWRRLPNSDRDKVLEEVYYRQWSLEDMLRLNRLDPNSEEFCKSAYFVVLLEIVNGMRKQFFKEPEGLDE